MVSALAWKTKLSVAVLQSPPSLAPATPAAYGTISPYTLASLSWRMERYLV
jgi:hypothetical protein